MKIILFSRPQIAHTAEDMGRLLPLVERYGFDYAINQEFAEAIEQLLGITIPRDKIYADATGPQPADSVMVCCGGDGTLLEGIHRLSDRSIPVAGVNFGHLGFLTSATREDVEQLFDDIANHRLQIQPRTMLEIEGIGEAGRTVSALNEVAVQRLEATMIKVEAKVNSQRVAQYNGDGVILSTPTGSTAYSLSAGGPIVAPECGCFLLTPLAPHNFGMRPVVVPDSAEVELTIHTRHGSAMLAVDNRSYRIGDGERIVVRRARQQILLAVQHNISFYETLHSKMMWDVDIRN
ncbi:MAG: NAD(+)/NADH kinase [Rikenellaceae bacterium]|nr:NADH kinase [Rikenellaceae bacterium]MBR7114351.1 NAD(+)/NADH kinase [Alistipes sp.]MDO5487434.1 NAD(+)/NADH kinase [Rikenellaceae bacterium]